MAKALGHKVIGEKFSGQYSVLKPYEDDRQVPDLFENSNNSYNDFENGWSNSEISYDENFENDGKTLNSKFYDTVANVSLFP
jgi:hypothetical protein